MKDRGWIRVVLGEEWGPQGAMRGSWLQLWAEGRVCALMPPLPGEWVWLRSAGTAAVGKEASAEPGGGRLCREHTGLDSSLGYPEQRAESPGCHTLSLGDRQHHAWGQTGAPWVGWLRGLQQHWLNQLHPS